MTTTLTALTATTYPAKSSLRPSCRLSFSSCILTGCPKFKIEGSQKAYWGTGKNELGPSLTAIVALNLERLTIAIFTLQFNRSMRQTT